MMNPVSDILLVDDDPQNLFLMAEILKLEGYHVRLAESGWQALDAVQAQLPQLILLDVMMPDMDGFELCQRLRSDAQAATVPILFLTALDDDDSHLKSVQVLGDDFLTKPIKMDLLLQKITNVLELRKLRDAAYQRQLAEQAEAMQALNDRYRRQMMAAWQISETLAEKFHLFVPKQFLNRVAPRGVESIQVGNAIESDMTILFCDIREFTAIAELQQARDTFKWLNVFFESINWAVMQNRGFVDKYLGDAVMAVFDQEQTHAADALNATLQICEALERFNRNRHQFDLVDPIRIGIGVHAGTGLIGTVGANQRMDTTVVGDVVNTASRLEALTKVYECPVIVSQTVLARLPEGHTFQFHWRDRVTPRGKKVALDIYEFRGCENCAPSSDRPTQEVPDPANQPTAREPS